MVEKEQFKHLNSDFLVESAYSKFPASEKVEDVTFKETISIS